MIRLVQFSCLVWLVVLSSYFMFVQPAVAQAVPTVIPLEQVVVNERHRLEIERLQRDMDALQKMGVEPRLQLLESTMSEVKWVGRSIAGVLITQLGLYLAGRKRER